MLVATESLTVGNLNSPHPLPVGNLNSFSFATTGISSFSTAGTSLFTVPAGISQILVKAWGAGGAGGGQSNCGTFHAGDGAGGSFAAGIIGVTQGQVLTIAVGGGGTGVLVSGSTVGLPGGQGFSSTAGGSGGYGGNGNLGNGGGGAASGVFLVTTSTIGLVVAGGGGAGGGFSAAFGPNGGSASAVGVGGASNANGTAGSSSGYGGGGGGGGATQGGTGGGAGLAGATGNSVGGTIIYGTGKAAGNTDDVNYSTASPSQGYPNGNETRGVGTGGDGGAITCFGQSGNRGAVVLYNATAATMTVLGNLVVSGTIIGGNSLPTRQVFTSAGSGVYYSTTSTGAMPRQLRIRMLGGGGGGGGSENAIGTTASSTVFGSISAYGGIGGATTQTTGIGGLGGNGGTSSSIVTRTPGNTGICEVRQVNQSGANAVSGTGHGGAGGYYISGSRGGCWGGDGETVEIIINNPASSYTYSVSTGANGTTGDAYNGGKGSTGSITADEFY
jgi:hypothetical protein